MVDRSPHIPITTSPYDSQQEAKQQCFTFDPYASIGLQDSCQRTDRSKRRRNSVGAEMMANMDPGSTNRSFQGARTQLDTQSFKRAKIGDESAGELTDSQAPTFATSFMPFGQYADQNSSTEPTYEDISCSDGFLIDSTTNDGNIDLTGDGNRVYLGFTMPHLEQSTGQCECDQCKASGNASAGLEDHDSLVTQYGFDSGFQPATHTHVGNLFAFIEPSVNPAHIISHDGTPSSRQASSPTTQNSPHQSNQEIEQSPRSESSTERTITCDEPGCHSKFKGKPKNARSNKNRHMIEVHGDSAHHCEYCSTKLTRRNNLETHIRTKHPETGKGIAFLQRFKTSSKRKRSS